MNLHETKSKLTPKSNVLSLSLSRLNSGAATRWHLCKNFAEFRKHAIMCWSSFVPPVVLSSEEEEDGDDIGDGGRLRSSGRAEESAEQVGDASPWSSSRLHLQSERWV